MPPTQLLIKHAQIVNEGHVIEADLRVKGQRIDQIGTDITPSQADIVVDAQGQYLLPGMIDDQVHFREPGLTHKGTIASESRAAVVGGITSYMEMSNVNPVTSSKIISTLPALCSCHLAQQNSTCCSRL